MSDYPSLGKLETLLAIVMKLGSGAESGIDF